jgi:hypothetical protein
MQIALLSALVVRGTFRRYVRVAAAPSASFGERERR